jgi:hypothetical protein
MRPAIALLVVLAAAPAAAQTDPAERKAFRLSLWGTAIPVAAGAAIWAVQGPQTANAASSHDRTGPAALIAGGLIFGPTFGYTSAGLSGRGWRGAGLRIGLTLLSVVPAVWICGDCSKGDTEYDLALLTMATGAGLSLASAVYDISRVKHNVRRRSETRPGPGLSFAPVYVPGQRSLGFRLGITF